MSRMEEFSIVDTKTGGRQSLRFGYNPQTGGTFEPIVPPMTRSIDEEDDVIDDDGDEYYSPVDAMAGGGRRSRIEKEALDELLGHAVSRSKHGGRMHLAEEDDSPRSIQDGGDSDSASPRTDHLDLMTDPGIMRATDDVVDLANDDQSPEVSMLGGSRPVADSKQAWWKQTGGCADSSQCGTSSIENIVSGFVNDALQGGRRAAKKNMRRPVSSASVSSESESEDTDSEEEAPKKGKKAPKEKKEKSNRAPTDWMIYLAKVRETVGNAENSNKVALFTVFASSYKKAAEAQGKTGKDLYKAALDSFLAEWKSGVGKKKLAAMKPKEK